MMTLGNTNSAFSLSLLLTQRDIVTLFITNEENSNDERLIEKVQKH